MTLGRIILGRIIVGATLGAGLVAITGVGASAAIVCKGSVCWHAHERYAYPPSAGVIVHEDNWRSGPTIRFHEHEGRGYWKGDTWTSW